MLYVLTMTYASGHLSETLSAAHRAWVVARYEDSVFLASGPTTGRPGGVAIAHARDRAAIDALVASDPVVVAGAGSYDVVEVAVSLAAPALAWLTTGA